MPFPEETESKFIAEKRCKIIFLNNYFYLNWCVDKSILYSTRSGWKLQTGLRKKNQNKNHCPPIMIRGKVSPITINIIVFIRLLHKQIRMICIKKERFTCADCTSIWIKLWNGIITWKYISNKCHTENSNWRTKPTFTHSAMCYCWFSK